MDDAIRQRDYASAIDAMDATGPIETRVQTVVDVLWNALRDAGVSWLGFYIDHPDQPDDRRLILGPCRDKPACSPIGLQGVCGQALSSKKTRIVRDVKDLGASYVACDPRDRSEIVVPLINERGECWGVLDLDSYDIRAFDESDDRGLRDVLRAAGLIA